MKNKKDALNITKSITKLNMFEIDFEVSLINLNHCQHSIRNKKKTTIKIDEAKKIYSYSFRPQIFFKSIVFEYP